MADAPLTHTDLALHGRQVFEYSVETDGNGVRSPQALPGFYEVYTVVDGVEVVVARRKAAGLLADIQRAQDAADNAPAPTESPVEPVPAQPPAFAPEQPAQPAQPPAPPVP